MTYLVGASARHGLICLAMTYRVGSEADAWADLSAYDVSNDGCHDGQLAIVGRDAAAIHTYEHGHVIGPNPGSQEIASSSWGGQAVQRRTIGCQCCIPSLGSSAASPTRSRFTACFATTFATIFSTHFAPSFCYNFSPPFLPAIIDTTFVAHCSQHFSPPLLTAIFATTFNHQLCHRF